jgi:hypothetical protein
MSQEAREVPAYLGLVRGEEMLEPEEVAAMSRLHALGWGARKLSAEFGCARNTVRRYRRGSVFDGLDDWLRERFFRQGGNADVIRQEMASDLSIVIGLRSVELRVQKWRKELDTRNNHAFLVRSR